VASEALSKIDRIYLVAPMAWDVGMMNDFIDFAREKGVNKFLLLSASQSEAGGPSLGQVHAHLKKLGAQCEVQWIVIRPTWFIGRFISFFYFLFF
jgi:festuclavine dehydrogenase